MDGYGLKLFLSNVCKQLINYCILEVFQPSLKNLKLKLSH